MRNRKNYSASSSSVLAPAMLMLLTATAQAGNTLVGPPSVSIQIHQGSKPHLTLTSYAISKTCRVPLGTVLNQRTKRGRPDLASCMYTTADIIDIYTRVFGDALQTWSQEHFDNLVQTILHTGYTGIHGISRADEEVLIHAVQMQQHIGDSIEQSIAEAMERDPDDRHDGWLSELAFRHTQEVYAQYAASTLDNPQPGSSGTQRQLDTPQQFQLTGALGLYSIDVRYFRSEDIPPIVPRTYSNGTWQYDLANLYETVILNEHTLPDINRHELRHNLRLWLERYKKMDLRFHLYRNTPDMQLRALAQVVTAGPSAAMNMLLVLDRTHSSRNHDMYFAVTRYQGRIVSLSMIEPLDMS